MNDITFSQDEVTRILATHIRDHMSSRFHSVGRYKLQPTYVMKRSLFAKPSLSVTFTRIYEGA